MKDTTAAPQSFDVNRLYFDYCYHSLPRISWGSNLEPAHLLLMRRVLPGCSISLANSSGIARKDLNWIWHYRLHKLPRPLLALPGGCSSLLLDFSSCCSRTPAWLVGGQPQGIEHFIVMTFAQHLIPNKQFTCTSTCLC